MTEEMTQQVDTGSEKFNEGVEAGLNSTEDSKNWHAGNELGQELKDEGEKGEPVSEIVLEEPATPLFMKNAPGGNKGNAQDEKDETEE
jgi:hypothetical protein